MNNRIKIINSEIQKAVSQIITYELQNPKITGIISVLEVNTTSDLDTSKITLSIFTPDDKIEVFNQIKHSASFIRQQLAKKVDLRKMPYLTFELDNSAQYHAEIDSLLKKVNETKKDEE